VTDEEKGALMIVLWAVAIVLILVGAAWWGEAR
jgi:hypothetical protein